MPKTPLSHVQNRIVRVKRIAASQLLPNPDNWRTHGPEQTEAIQIALRDIGFVAPVIAREMADGELMLLDGHARVAQLAPNVEIPVAIVHCSDQEAAAILASLDPISAMAGTDQAALDRLLVSLREDGGEYEALLKLLADEDAAVSPVDEDIAPAPTPDIDFAPAVSTDAPAPFLPEVSDADLQRATNRVTKQAQNSGKDLKTLTCPHCGSDITFEPSKLV